MTKALLPHLVSLVFFVAQNCITSEGNPMPTPVPQGVSDPMLVVQPVLTHNGTQQTVYSRPTRGTQTYTKRFSRDVTSSPSAGDIPSPVAERFVGNLFYDSFDYVNDEPNPTFQINDEPSESEHNRNLNADALRSIRKKDRPTIIDYFRQYPVIEIHNKNNGRNIEISRKGEISLQSKSKLSTYFREHQHKNMTILTSIAHCYKLCLDKSGRVYTQDHGSTDSNCHFDKSLGYRDITQYIKLVSSEHSNSSHQMYLYPSSRKRLEGREFEEREVEYSEHLDPKNLREWVFSRVNETDVIKHRKKFRQKAGGRNEDGHVHYVLHREAWHSYCSAVVDTRRKEHKKRHNRIKDYCLNNKLPINQACKDEFICVRKRNKEEKLTGEDSKTICTQSERNKEFGLDWPWNTRNCSSLPRSDRKQCKKLKRKRCIAHKLSKNIPRRNAREECRGKKSAKKTSFYSKCYKKHKLTMSSVKAKKLCRRNNIRHNRRSTI